MDPLAQLQDIQLPEKIHNYPLAFGWWLVAFICIALLIFITVKFINYKRIRRSQKQAITQISSTEVKSTAEYVAILKWAALQYFPRERIANLYGESLYNFLLDTLPAGHQEKFTTLSANLLQTMYQQTATEKETNLKQASVYWLEHALPPKNNTVLNDTLAESK